MEHMNHGEIPAVRCSACFSGYDSGNRNQNIFFPDGGIYQNGFIFIINPPMIKLKNCLYFKYIYMLEILTSNSLHIRGEFLEEIYAIP